MFRHILCHPEGALMVLAKITCKTWTLHSMKGVAAYHGFVCAVCSVCACYAGRYVDAVLVCETKWMSVMFDRHQSLETDYCEYSSSSVLPCQLPFQQFPLLTSWLSSGARSEVHVRSQCHRNHSHSISDNIKGCLPCWHIFLCRQQFETEMP
jgi:hypothetical protein